MVWTATEWSLPSSVCSARSRRKQVRVYACWAKEQHYTRASREKFNSEPPNINTPPSLQLLFSCFFSDFSFGCLCVSVTHCTTECDIADGCALKESANLHRTGVFFFITRCSRSRRKRAFTSAWSIAGWVVKHPLYLHRHTLMLPYFNLKRKDWNPLGLKTTICSVGSCVRSSVHMPVARIYICSPFA